MQQQSSGREGVKSKFPVSCGRSNLSFGKQSYKLLPYVPRAKGSLSPILPGLYPMVLSSSPRYRSHQGPYFTRFLYLYVLKALYTQASCSRVQYSTISTYSLGYTFKGTILLSSPSPHSQRSMLSDSLLSHCPIFQILITISSSSLITTFPSALCS